MTRIAFRRPADSEPLLTPEEIVDLLWLSVAATDGIKHIHAREMSGAIEVIMFSVTSEQLISDYIVRRVCERAVLSIPALKDWFVIR